jgi:hypothetical protein
MKSPEYRLPGESYAMIYMLSPHRHVEQLLIFRLLKVLNIEKLYKYTG